MMYTAIKKVIGSAFILGMMLIPTMACKVIDFYDQSNNRASQDICIDINKETTRRFSIDLVDRTGTGDLKCMILVGNTNLLQDLGDCNDEEFVYDGGDESRIKIYARLGTGLWGSSEGYYDFSAGDRTTYQYDGFYDSSSSTTLDNFYISTTENTDGRYDIYVKARDDGNMTYENYNGTIRFKVYRRTTSSSNWYEITSTTSDFYELSVNYSDFTTADYGDKNITDFIKFKNFDYDYKLEVYDEEYTSKKGEKIFYIQNSNNDSSDNADLDNFYLSYTPTTPAVNDRIDLTIKARNTDNETLVDYDGSLRFKVYKRSSSASTWSEITSSASTYYTIDRSSYTFTTSQDGQATISDLIKFTNDNYDYKIRVYDYDDPNSYGEKNFYFVDDENNDEEDNTDEDFNESDGFSTSEITKIQKIYNVRYTVIRNIEKKYSVLKNDTNRQDLSDDFYQNLGYVLESNSAGDFDNYDDFLDGFMERYEYTTERM